MFHSPSNLHLTFEIEIEIKTPPILPRLYIFFLIILLVAILTVVVKVVLQVVTIILS